MKKKKDTTPLTKADFEEILDKRLDEHAGSIISEITQIVIKVINSRFERMEKDLLEMRNTLKS